MEERVKEFDYSFTNYLFVQKYAQNGGNYGRLFKYHWTRTD